MLFKKTNFEVSPLKYWEEQSYFLVLLPDDDSVLPTLIDRVKKIDNVIVKKENFEKYTGVLTLLLSYDNEDYEVGFYLNSFTLPPYYLKKSIFFKDEELKSLASSKRALTIYMKFNSNVKKSYHLQLKLAVNIVPDLLAIMDESAEKLIPKKSAKMAAFSKVLPSPFDLFTVQAVSDKNKGMWLHTHGLCRCHLSELEILDSNQKFYLRHYNLINHFASFLIDNSKNINAYDGNFIGLLNNNVPLVATFVPWNIGLKEYSNVKIGNIKDRVTNHNSNTSFIFLYTSKEDEKNKKLSKISVYNELLSDNPIFFISDEETKRMKELAIERFDYVKKAFQNKDNEINIKVGLLVDKKDNYEHIWYKLLEIKDDKFKAILLQEPYNVKNKHTGDVDWFSINEVTDWTIYTKKLTINPSNVYLLED